MRYLRSSLVLLACLATAGTAAAGYEARSTPRASLEERLLADATDGQFKHFSLLEAVLIASGVDDRPTLDRYREHFAALVDELRRSGAVAGTTREQAAALFAFMHGRIFTAGYRIDCTDLRLALDEGRFNCVSASVLYQCLAEEFRLPVRGLELPAHAMNRLALAEGPMEIETTCPRWFQLSEAERLAAKRAKARATPPSSDSAHGRVADSAAAATSPRQARLVSHVEMTAMIYYNRGVDLLGEKRFAEALAANTKALRLDPSSSPARSNLLATINNWSIDLAAAGRYADAAGLLRRGMALDPNYETFVLNFEHVHHQWAESLARSNRYADAIDLLARAAKEQPNRPYFRQALEDVRRRAEKK